MWRSSLVPGTHIAFCRSGVGPNSSDPRRSNPDYCHRGRAANQFQGLRARSNAGASVSDKDLELYKRFNDEYGSLS
ncbi:hypothetical protein BC938DRAFT_479630 [Jimgerdemannia flammicorona]|uniref:Uncharacterized protein n=1 Tax=Jimgerdemannia flammicorona TaxID=994334 RepID=A0A433QXN7_9FUNG|nr:hypothetical protein BC938DRAFT_479630 [Jimgerdemannia flammicorona]